MTRIGSRNKTSQCGSPWNSGVEERALEFCLARDGLRFPEFQGESVTNQDVAGDGEKVCAVYAGVLSLTGPVAGL